MKVCTKCNKLIWFWQDSWYRMKNILCKEKPLETYYFHSKCEKFGEVSK